MSILQPFNGLEPEILRYSVLSESISCPHKYWVKYVLKEKTELESSYFTLGKIVHKAIEDFLSCANSNPLTATPGEMSQVILGMFKEAWGSAFSQGSAFLFDEYFDLQSYAFKKTNEHGIKSRGEAYKSPEMTKYFKTNFAPALDVVKARIIKESETFEFIKYRSQPLEMYVQARTCIENFVRLHRDHVFSYGVPDQRLNEYKISPIDVSFLTPTNKTTLGGTMDYVEVYPRGDLFLWDFKTGKKKWSQFDVKNSDQLCWYSYACLIRLGKLPRLIGIWDLFNNQIIRHELSRGDMSRFFKRLKANLRYKSYLDGFIREHGGECLPVPMGLSMKAGCPCDLLWEKDSRLKCPYGELIEGDIK